MRTRIGRHGELYVDDGHGGWTYASDALGMDGSRRFEAMLYRFSWTWHFGDDGVSPLLWGDVDLGGLLTVPVHVRCVDTLRALWTLRSLADDAREPIDLEVDSAGERFARVLADVVGGGAVRLRVGGRFDNGTRASASFGWPRLPHHYGERIKRFLAERGLDYIARSLAARVTGHGVRRSAPGYARSSGAQLLMVADVFSTAVVEMLVECAIAAAQVGARPLVLCLDPRVGSVLSPFATVLYPHLVKRRDPSRAISGRQLVSRLGHRMGSSPVVFDGLDVRPLVQRKLMSVARSGLQIASTVIETVSSLAQSGDVDGVIVGSDSHVGTRAATYAAASAAIPSVTLQHGVVAGEFGYVPVVADIAAVWGPWCKEWYVHRGTPPNQVVVIGNPRFDRFTSMISSGRPRRRQLVLAPTDVGRERIMQLLWLTFGAVRQREDWEVVVRLHPGERSDEFVCSLVGEVSHGVRHRIDRGGPLSDLLVESEVLVTTQSSIGVEAILADCSLIVVTMPGLPDYIPYVEFGAAAPVSSVEAMVSCLERAETGVLRMELRAGRKEFLASYAGPVDGRAGARALEVLRTAQSGGAVAWKERLSRWHDVFAETG